MAKLKWIPASSVIGTVLQPRLQEDRGLEGLTESILQGGMNTPIAVVIAPPSAKIAKKTRAKAGPGPLYLMRSGHRRKAAVHKLVKRGVKKLPPGHARIVKGEAYVEAVILEETTSIEEHAIAALVDNVEREQLTPYEQASAYKKLAEKLKVNREDLALRVGTNIDTLDYMISALDPKNMTLRMIRSWKEQQLDMVHVKALMRLKLYKARQKKLYTKIIKEHLSAEETKFWCTQLLEKGDIPLERRTNALIAERLLKDPVLKQLIEDKQLGVRPSARGDQLTIKVDGPKKLREVCLAVAAQLKGLNL